MFEKVLVSMDLSPATEALVSALPDMRDLGTEEFILVHVAKPVRGPTSGSMLKTQDIRSRLAGLADRLREAGFTATVHVSTGAPAEEVLKTVEAKNPDVVLVGSRSHTLIREAFVGSVAWDIVRSVGCPVLLQKIEPNRNPEAALESRGTGFPKHVVFPTDFSETANRARPWLLGLIRNGAPSFSLLHVMSTESKEESESARSQLEELAQELRERGATDVSSRVQIGTPYEEIIKAGGNRADAFVVMGTHGRGLLPGVVMGSVGRQVVRHASARVLLLPGEASEAS